ncbi:oligosaccharide flippase family protein [Magnetococcales bacterium HHB-1]
MSTFLHRLRSGLFWNALQQWGNHLIKIITLLVLVRFLTPEDFGHFAFAMLIIQMIYLVAAQGLSVALVLCPDLDQGHVRVAYLAHGLAIMAVLSLLWGVSILWATPLLMDLLWSLSCGVILSLRVIVPLACHRRALNFQIMARILIISQAVGALMGIGIAWMGGGVWSLVIRYLSEHVITVLMLYKYRDTQPVLPLSSDRTPYRTLMRLGWPLFATNFMIQQGERLAEWIIGTFMGTFSLGLYSVAQQPIKMASQLVPAVIHVVTLPLFAHERKKADSFQATLKITIQLLGLTVFPLFATIAWLAPDWVPLLLGDAWLQVIPLIMPLMMIAAVRAWLRVNFTVIVAQGYTKKRFWLALITTSLTSLTVWLSWPYGLEHIVWALVITTLFLVPWEFFWIKKTLPIGLMTQLYQLWPGMMITGIILGTLWWTRGSLDLLEQLGVVLLIYGTIGGGYLKRCLKGPFHEVS